MRWERLFADLEAQFDAEERVEQEAEIADRTQREQALVRLADRVRASAGSAVELRLRGCGMTRGEVTAIGRDWLALTTPNGDVLVPLAAVQTVRGLVDRGVAAERSLVSARLGLGYAIRVLMRERAFVVATLVDGWKTAGEIALVGADYFELVVAADDDEPARRRQIRITITFEALAAVTRSRADVQ